MSDTERDALIGAYLADQRARAAAGLTLARRFRAENEDTFLRDTLFEVCAEIEEDLRTLDGIVSRLGLRKRISKDAVARATVLARAQCRRHAVPLRRLKDFEALTACVVAKQSLWKMLAIVAERRTELDDVDLAELQRRAEHQRALLESHRNRIAMDAFVAPR